jgi:hypothetical protein
MNGKVTQWYDRSGNNFHSSQVNESEAPTFQMTDPGVLKPSISFDGMDDYLSGVPILSINNSSFCLNNSFF